MTAINFTPPTGLDHVARINTVLARYRIAPINIQDMIEEIDNTRRIGRSRRRSIFRGQIEGQIVRIRNILNTRNINRTTMGTGMANHPRLTAAYNERSDAQSRVAGFDRQISHIDNTIETLITNMNSLEGIQDNIMNATNELGRANNNIITYDADIVNFNNRITNLSITETNIQAQINHLLSTGGSAAAMHNLQLQLATVQRELADANLSLRAVQDNRVNAINDRIVNTNLINNLNRHMTTRRARHGAVGLGHVGRELHDIVEDFRVQRDNLHSQRDVWQNRLDRAEQTISNEEYLLGINMTDNNDDILLQSYINELEEGLRTINGSSIPNRFVNDIRRLFTGNF